MTAVGVRLYNNLINQLSKHWGKAVVDLNSGQVKLKKPRFLSLLGIIYQMLSIPKSLTKSCLLRGINRKSLIESRI